MAHRSSFIVTEGEMARALKLLRRSFLGNTPFTPAVVEAVTMATFPFAMEFWAGLAPMERRGDGWLCLDVPVAARCWPEGAETTADSRFRTGPVSDEVRVNALTGAWEDANGARPGFAYVGAAARVWRRPGAPCGPQEAAQRWLALLGAAIILERQGARGYEVDGPSDDLPFISSPPLAPEDSSEGGAPAAPAPVDATAAGSSDPLDGPKVPVPAAVVEGLEKVADVLGWLARHDAVAAIIRAHDVDPDDIAECADLVGSLARDALAGRWAITTTTTADARRADVVSLTHERRRRGRSEPRPQAATASMGYAETIRATARTAADLAAAAADPAWAAAMTAKGLRLDQLADFEAAARRFAAGADQIERLAHEAEALRAHLPGGACPTEPTEPPPAA